MRLKAFLLVLSLISQVFAQTLTNTQKVTIDPLSVQSLFIEIFSGNTSMGTATGFIYRYDNSDFLITNWHVVSGRDPNNNKIIDPLGRTPDKIGIWHNNKVLGSWARRFEVLYKNGKHLWKEHKNGRAIDVVALPITTIDDSLQIYPFDIKLSETDMIPQVGMPISIIGFPLGMSGPGKLAIWKTGHIATEPEVEFSGLPYFMVDATTRQGMSGSPVVLRLSGGYKTKSGGSVMSTSGIQTKFLGIYSGQWVVSEIGKVWLPKVIQEILVGN